jgi:hypothetical protein
MARFFISYRKRDTGADADLIAKTLSDGEHIVFLDRQGITPGDDYVDRIRGSLSQSHVVLALIGKYWATDQDGRRRLHEQSDWVRREIAIALEREKRIVPVLFDGLRESPKDLPDDLASLSRIQAYPVDRDYFARDAKDLIGRIEGELFPASPPPRTERRSAIAAALAPQLRSIWIILFAVTMAAVVARAFMPVLPGTVWVFPCALTIAVFVAWLACLSIALEVPGLRAT